VCAIEREKSKPTQCVCAKCACMCDTERERESAKPNRCVLTQQRTATHCNKHTATHLHKMYISKFYTPTHLWETHLCVTARHCNTHTATHCNTLQHTVHLYIRHPNPFMGDTPVCDCKALQHTATHTATHTLQHTATHCNTLYISKP